MTPEKVLSDYIAGIDMTLRQSVVLSEYGIESVKAVKKELIDVYTTATINSCYNVRERVRKHYDRIKGYNDDKLMCYVFTDQEKLLSIDDVNNIINELNKC